MTLPQDIRFVQSHEYMAPGPDGVQVGISKYAADQLGDVVFVELPPVGRKVTKGESFGVVESVKAVSDLYAPLDGEVAAVNEALAAEPGLVGEDPYARGWIVKIRPGDESQLAAPGTMDADAYDAFVGNL